MANENEDFTPEDIEQIKGIVAQLKAKKAQSPSQGVPSSIAPAQKPFIDPFEIQPSQGVPGSLLPPQQPMVGVDEMFRMPESQPQAPSQSRMPENNFDYMTPFKQDLESLKNALGMSDTEVQARHEAFLKNRQNMKSTIKPKAQVPQYQDGETRVIAGKIYTRTNGEWVTR